MVIVRFSFECWWYGASVFFVKPSGAGVMLVWCSDSFKSYMAIYTFLRVHLKYFPVGFSCPYSSLMHTLAGWRQKCLIRPSCSVGSHSEWLFWLQRWLKTSWIFSRALKELAVCKSRPMKNLLWGSRGQRWINDIICSWAKRCLKTGSWRTARFVLDVFIAMETAQIYERVKERVRERLDVERRRWLWREGAH